MFALICSGELGAANAVVTKGSTMGNGNDFACIIGWLVGATTKGATATVGGVGRKTDAAAADNTIGSFWLS